jgi:hypothetical protein
MMEFSPKPQSIEDALAERNRARAEQKVELAEKAAAMTAVLQGVDLANQPNVNTIMGGLTVEQLKTLRDSLDWSIGVREQAA